MAYILQALAFQKSSSKNLKDRFLSSSAIGIFISVPAALHRSMTFISSDTFWIQGYYLC